MIYIWNPWIGYTKPLMDFRNDGPMPSPPDDPPASENCFWHSCNTSTAPAALPFDAAIIVVPPLFDATSVVEPPGFDAIN